MEQKFIDNAKAKYIHFNHTLVINIIHSETRPLLLNPVDVLALFLL